MSLPQIARDVECARSTAAASVGRLLKAGLLTAIRSSGKCTQYRTVPYLGPKPCGSASTVTRPIGGPPPVRVADESAPAIYNARANALNRETTKEQAAAEESMKAAKQEKLPEPEPPQPQAEPVDREAAVSEAIVICRAGGMDGPSAKQIAHKHALSHIQRTAAYVDWREAKGYRIQNRGAFLRIAIQQNYAATTFVFSKPAVSPPCSVCSKPLGSSSVVVTDNGCIHINCDPARAPNRGAHHERTATDENGRCARCHGSGFLSVHPQRLCGCDMGLELSRMMERDRARIKPREIPS